MVKEIQLLYKKFIAYNLVKNGVVKIHSKKINLCCGDNIVDGYINVGMDPRADIVVDLDEKLLPIQDNSIDEVICNSAISCFARDRAQVIVKEVYRVLKKGGVARFTTQDLNRIASRDADTEEWTLNDISKGNEVEELADRYGYCTYDTGMKGKTCKYFYDFETLAHLFTNVGFQVVEQRQFRDSRISDIEKFDNCPGQMFFLESVK